eukprot:RCo054708
MQARPRLPASLPPLPDHPWGSADDRGYVLVVLSETLECLLRCLLVVRPTPEDLLPFLSAWSLRRGFHPELPLLEAELWAELKREGVVGKLAQVSSLVGPRSLPGSRSFSGGSVLGEAGLPPLPPPAERVGPGSARASVVALQEELGKARAAEAELRRCLDYSQEELLRANRRAGGLCKEGGVFREVAVSSTPPSAAHGGGEAAEPQQCSGNSTEELRRTQAMEQQHELEEANARASQALRTVSAAEVEMRELRGAQTELHRSLATTTEELHSSQQKADELQSEVRELRRSLAAANEELNIAQQRAQQLEAQVFEVHQASAAQVVTPAVANTRVDEADSCSLQSSSAGSSEGRSAPQKLLQLQQEVAELRQAAIQQEAASAQRPSSGASSVELRLAQQKVLQLQKELGEAEAALALSAASTEEELLDLRQAKTELHRSLAAIKEERDSAQQKADALQRERTSTAHQWSSCGRWPLCLEKPAANLETARAVGCPACGWRCKARE